MLKIGFTKLPKESKRVESDSKRFFKNFLPAIWGNSTAQIMAFLDTWLASFLISGSISYLYYANRVFQLPLALFAIALSVAIFPTISKLIKHNKFLEAKGELKKGFWILVFLLSISALGGVIFSKEIIWLLFERGAFQRDDTLMTSSILQMYMIGLLPFGLSKLLSLWLYSQHRQLEAAKIATWSLIGYVFVALILFKPFGAMGLAFASTVSGFISFYLLIKSFGIANFREMFDIKLMIFYTISITAFTILFYFLHIFLIGYLES